MAEHDALLPRNSVKSSYGRLDLEKGELSTDEPDRLIVTETTTWQSIIGKIAVNSSPASSI
jgi:hypothetical protein